MVLVVTSYTDGTVTCSKQVVLAKKPDSDGWWRWLKRVLISRTRQDALRLQAAFQPSHLCLSGQFIVVSVLCMNRILYEHKAPPLERAR